MKDRHQPSQPQHDRGVGRSNPFGKKNQAKLPACRAAVSGCHPELKIQPDSPPAATRGLPKRFTQKRAGHWFIRCRIRI